MGNFRLGQGHLSGLGEPVPTCGGLPHEQLPWFPRGWRAMQRRPAGVPPMSDCIKTGADAGSAHRPMRHERLH
ncbi:MAG: hypothetical protein F6K26_25035 [Moorea sp. SIO2I5]|nr:hypothetical protein [Moorena sp. SIO2I5]